MFHDKLSLLRRGAEARRSETLEEREHVLERFERSLREWLPRFCSAMSEDFGKPREEALLVELYPTLQGLKTARAKLRRWARPQAVATPLALWGTRSWLRPEPRGLCLILAPWNYPVNLALGPLTSALAAGCTVALKPSELTPRTSALLREFVAATFAPEHVRVFEGAADVANALLDHPFDHIFFTGSPRVGRIVMEKAARHLTSVTLELGGKSPAIVDASADLERAARAIAWGKFINSGQTCIAPDYVLVHERVAEAFRERLLASLREMEGSRPGTERSHLVSVAHAERVDRLRAEALGAGARSHRVAEVPSSLVSSRPLEILEGLAPEAPLRREEIFGPLLPLVTFRSANDLAAEVARSPRPLALYLFARDREFLDHCLARIPAGGVCINETLQHFGNEELPFGGVGPSGFGASHGEHGFRAFSHLKAVLERRHSSWIARLLHPPYGPRARRLIRLLIDWL